MRSFRPLLRAGATLLAVIAIGCPAAEPIIVGQSGPLTGGNAEIGHDIRNGALAYFQKANAGGGIFGRKIELLTLDDKNDRANARANAAKLLRTNNLVALFGFASATLSLDAIPLAVEERIPFFAPFTGAEVMHRQSPYVFTVRASYKDELAKILNFWSSLGIERVAVIHYDDEVGNQNFQTVAEFMKAAKKTSTSVKIKRNAKVPPETLDAIIKADPQVIVLTTLFGPAAEIVHELNAKKRPYIYSSLSFIGASQFASTAGAEAAGVSIASVVPLPSSAIPVVKECGAAIAKIEGAKFNFTSLEACIAAKVLVEGMRRGGRELTRESLYRGLQALGTYDAGGYVVTFGPDARHGSSFVDLSVITKHGGFRS